MTALWLIVLCGVLSILYAIWATSSVLKADAGNARMQDTAEGFGQPIRRMFGPFFRMEIRLPSPFDEKPSYGVTIDDHFWHWIYLPIARLTEAVAKQVGRLQQGRIAVYLLYSFVTLIAMLVLVRL